MLHNQGGITMKKSINRLMVLVVIMMVLLIAATPVFAGGGQVRGEKALGSAVQVQVQDPPPFQP